MPDPDAAPYLYLTTTGWKTGRAHEIEIWYVHREGRYYVVAEGRQHAHWVQNITRSPEVTFRVGESQFRGTARLITHEAEPALADAVSTLMEARYGWSDGLIVELVPT